MVTQGRDDVHAQARSRPRDGFTLVELMVVIALVAVLVGLLLPAVQLARESARRSHCLNNIRQIATAMTLYDSANNALPGWRNSVGTFPVAVSWTVPILPSLGNKEAFDYFDNYTDASDDIGGKKMPVFVCSTAADDAARFSKAPLNYAVNAGTGAEHAASGANSFVDSGHRQFVGDGVFHDRLGYDANANGSYAEAPDYSPAKSSLGDVIEGSGGSFTLMLAERSGRDVLARAAGIHWTPLRSGTTWSQQPLPVATGSSNAVTTSHVFMHPMTLTSGSAEPSTTYRVINPQTCSAVLDAGGNCDLRFPTSQHRGDGVVAAFCDGRTMFLSSKIDSWVYGSLLTAKAASACSPRAQDWQKKNGVNYLPSEDDITVK